MRIATGEEIEDPETEHAKAAAAEAGTRSNLPAITAGLNGGFGR
jgi:hypothetical protein